MPNLRIEISPWHNMSALIAAWAKGHQHTTRLYILGKKEGLINVLFTFHFRKKLRVDLRCLFLWKFFGLSESRYGLIILQRR